MHRRGPSPATPAILRQRTLRLGERETPSPEPSHAAPASEEAVEARAPEVAEEATADAEEVAAEATTPGVRRGLADSGTWKPKSSSESDKEN